MRKILILSLSVSFSVITLLSSCSGCVKSTTKKITELGIEAAEGVAEAVDEHGARVGEKVADATGKVAEGVGRSLDRQLNEHATEVAAVGGRTLVQTVDGFTQGFNAEVETHYDVLPYTDNFSSGVSLDYFAKYKTKPIVDAYFIIMEEGTYKCTFECKGNDGKIFLTKEAQIVKNAGERKYSLVSFALNPQEETVFTNLKDIKITVSKN